MPNEWHGVITVKLEAEFVYEIDEDWEANDDLHAREMVRQDLNEYMGKVNNRFHKTWTIEETNV